MGGVLGRAALHRGQRRSGRRPTPRRFPPMNGIFGQKGLPRTPEEVTRATATYKGQGCEVKTNGARLEISFPGVTAGVFTTGRLQYDVFKGSNLIRQVVIAKTEQPSVAFKYDARAQGAADSGRVARGLARPRRPLAGPAVWRRDQQGSGHGMEQQSPDRRRAAGRIDRGVPAAAQLLRRARIEPGPRRQLLPQGQRRPRSRSASARPRRKRTRSSSTTSRSPARGPAPGSRCRCSSTSARSPRRRPLTRR